MKLLLYGGAGLGQQPAPVARKQGQQMRCGIAGLGVQGRRMVAATTWNAA